MMKQSSLKKKLIVLLVCFAICSMGCARKENKDKQYQASFKVDGREKHYLTEKGELNTGDGYWEWWWFQEPEDLDSNGSLMLMLRDTPETGQVFEADDIKFSSEAEKEMFAEDDEDELRSVEMLYEDESGAMYLLNGLYGEGRLVVTNWEGPGGFLSGNFSGEFFEPETGKTVDITDGHFKVFITKK